MIQPKDQGCFQPGLSSTEGAKLLQAFMSINTATNEAKTFQDMH